MSNGLSVKKVVLNIGTHTVLHEVSFNLKHGEIACLLGPSGCGKTSLLRTIAGFNTPFSGEITIDGTVIANSTTSIAVEKRNMGMVFQDLALYPHLTIADNIAFGIRHWRSNTQNIRINTLSGLLKIETLLNKFPHELSGGQQQRAAIARALAPRPGILLLDEPFSSLDPELRAQLAMEIRNVLKEEKTMAILVSHDQREAFAIADVIGVMRAGNIVQWTNAFEIYHQPENEYVARFIGEGVFLPGTVIDEKTVSTEIGLIQSKQDLGLVAETPVRVLIRPDDILHDDTSPLCATVENKIFRGAQFLYTLSLPSGNQIQSLIPSHHNHTIKEAIGIRLEIEHLVVFNY